MRFFSFQNPEPISYSQVSAANPIILKGYQTGTSEENIIVTLVNNGYITALSKNGKMLWQVDTGVHWGPKDNLVKAGLYSITLNINDPYDQYIFAQGPRLALLSASGQIISKTTIDSIPIRHPSFGDIDNDGITDVIINSGGYYTIYSLRREGNWLFTAIVIILLLIIIALAIQERIKKFKPKTKKEKTEKVN